MVIPTSNHTVVVGFQGTAGAQTENAILDLFVTLDEADIQLDLQTQGVDGCFANLFKAFLDGGRA